MSLRPHQGKKRKLYNISQIIQILRGFHVSISSPISFWVFSYNCLQTLYWSRYWFVKRKSDRPFSWLPIIWAQTPPNPPCYPHVSTTMMRRRILIIRQCLIPDNMWIVLQAQMEPQYSIYIFSWLQYINLKSYLTRTQCCANEEMLLAVGRDNFWQKLQGLALQLSPQHDDDVNGVKSIIDIACVETWVHCYCLCLYYMSSS